MLKEYKNYCESPCLETAYPLLEAIEFTDYNDSLPEQLFDIWIKADVQPSNTYLFSTGTTTGKVKKYKFGPLDYFFINKIEDIIRDRRNNLQIFLLNFFWLKTIKTNDEPIINERISVNGFTDEWLIKFLKLLSNKEKFFIHSYPYVFLHLCSNPIFIEFCKKNKNNFFFK